LEITRIISIVILLIVASGWRPRYTAIFHWWIAFSLHASAITVDGGDQLTAVLTMLILPIALTDKRKWHWQPAPIVEDISQAEVLRRITALVTFAAIRFQVAIVYFHAAVGKLSVGDWANGTVLYYWFTDPIVGLPDWLTIFLPVLHSPFVVVITWLTLILEILLFMALVMPRPALKYCLIAGIIFHLAIALAMGLISFSIAMVAALVLYLRPFDQDFAFSFARKLFRSRRLAERKELFLGNVAGI
jgi:antimicrobial peptide system SdpB family protein